MIYNISREGAISAIKAKRLISQAQLGALYETDVVALLDDKLAIKVERSPLYAAKNNKLANKVRAYELRFLQSKDKIPCATSFKEVTSGRLYDAFVLSSRSAEEQQKMAAGGEDAFEIKDRKKIDYLTGEIAEDGKIKIKCLDSSTVLVADFSKAIEKEHKPRKPKAETPKTKQSLADQVFGQISEELSL